MLRALAGRWDAAGHGRALTGLATPPRSWSAVVLTSATLSRQPVVYALELVLNGAAPAHTAGDGRVGGGGVAFALKAFGSWRRAA
ncbi:MAG: hypothetical protein IPN47_10265 [Gemmatimonadetes bacterium]|nr:hypothetical protein [Gemmatimonadota bacterium]